MNYTVKLTPSALKDLEGFRGALLIRIERIITGLYEDPRPHNSKKLAGCGSKWRICTGDYRVLYEIDDLRKIVRVYRIAHRSEVYR